jgi:DnaJ-class molecular chaperone
MVTCPQCLGSGVCRQCQTCEGRGWYYAQGDAGIWTLITDGIGLTNKKSTCPRCNGTGDRSEGCRLCSGTGQCDRSKIPFGGPRSH